MAEDASSGPLPLRCILYHTEKQLQTLRLPRHSHAGGIRCQPRRLFHHHRSLYVGELHKISPMAFEDILKRYYMLIAATSHPHALKRRIEEEHDAPSHVACAGGQADRERKQDGGVVSCAGAVDPVQHAEGTHSYCKRRVESKELPYGSRDGWLISLFVVLLKFIKAKCDYGFFGEHCKGENVFSMFCREIQDTMSRMQMSLGQEAKICRDVLNCEDGERDEPEILATRSLYFEHPSTTISL